MCKNTQTSAQCSVRNTITARKLVCFVRTRTSLLLLVWQAPLGVRSAKRRHQSPEWTILSHSTVIASSSERLFDLRSCWIVFIHVVRGRPGGFFQFSEGEAVMILLASVSSGILAIGLWPNRERRRAWTIADRRGCPLVRLTLSFRTWWYHLILNNFRKHHWSTASILSTSLGDCPALRAIQKDR